MIYEDDKSRTPSLAEVIRKGAVYELGQVHTVVACRVVSYDRQNNQADVKPIMNQTFTDGDTQQFPVIPSCPVHVPEFGGFTLKAPLEEGQAVTLLVNERSMDEWVIEGNTDADARDRRRFDLSDGIVLAGIRPEDDPIIPEEGTLTIGSEDVEIRLKEDGTFAVESDGVELLELMDDFLDEADSLRSQVDAIADAISRSTVATAAGPQPLVPASAEMAAIRTQLAEIATRINTIQLSLDILKE